jgi:peptide/nickel transport system substrate-binding protein
VTPGRTAAARPVRAGRRHSGADRRPRSPARLAALAIGVALAIGSAGCQNRGGPPDPASVPGMNAGTTAARSPSERAGGTLRLVTSGVDSLDPARSYSPSVWNVMRLYTRQLVTFAPAAGPAGARLVPDLATSLGRTSDGGRTWTYTLRAGLRWEDGRAVTSRDVKYGIERLFASDLLPGGPTWAVGLLDDRSAPYDGPYRDRTPGRLGLRSIATPNSRTITFRLIRPFANWNSVLALPASSPVPAARDAGAAYGAHPISAGPYRVVGMSERGVLSFVRNRQWSRATDPVRRALPDRIDLATGILPAERDRRLLTGEADADVSGTGLQPDAAAQALAEPLTASRVDAPTTGTVRFVAMPASVPPFGNVHCRRAVQYALDKAAVKEALGGEYAAAMATTLWPRALPGYPASAPYPSREGNHGDLDAAHTELARCGRPGGFVTGLTAVDDGRGPVVARQTIEALSRVGIHVRMRTYPRGVFLSTVVGSPAVVKRSGLGLIVADWSADFPSPYAFLVPLLDGRSIRARGSPNLAGVSTDAIERAVDEAAATTDPIQATAAWREVETLGMRDASYAPLVEDRALLLGSARLRNAYVHPAFHGYDVVSLGVR